MQETLFEHKLLPPKFHSFEALALIRYSLQITRLTQATTLTHVIGPAVEVHPNPIPLTSDPHAWPLVN